MGLQSLPKHEQPKGPRLSYVGPDRDEEWTESITSARPVCREVPASYDSMLVEWVTQGLASSSGFFVAGTSFSTIDAKDIQAVGQRFAIQRRTEVLALLRKRPSLIPILIEAQTHILEHFGREARLSLEPSVAAETEGDDAVVITIKVHAGVEEALTRLHALYRDWWFGVMANSGGHIVFDVEPV